MFKTLKTLIVFIALFLGLRVFAADTIVQADDIAGIVSAQNLAGHNNTMGFEKPGGWVASGSPTTAARTQTVGKVYRGTYAYEWDSNATGQLLTSPTWSTGSDGGLVNRNVAAGCFVKVPSGTATHLLSVVVSGSDVSNTQQVVSSGAFEFVVVNFVAKASTSYSVQLKSVASNEPAVDVDDCFFADAAKVNISNVTQARVYATIKFSGASCSNTRTSSSLGSLGAATCTTTITGPITTPASSTAPIFTMPNAPAGTYLISANGNGYCAGGTDSDQAWAVVANSTVAGANASRRILSGATFTQVPGTIAVTDASYTLSTTGSLVVELQNRGDGTNACTADNRGEGLFFTVTYFPSTAQQAVQQNSQITPTQQVLTAASGTYTTPSRALMLQIDICGAGGGGGGGGISGGSAGGNGNSSTFGSSLITAGGGTGGAPGSGTSLGGGGGTSFTVNSPAFGYAIPGNDGLSGQLNAAGTASTVMGGGGSGTPLFGGGAHGGTSTSNAGAGGVANTGAGGGGSGGSGSASGGGGGGGSGACGRAWIMYPSSSYSYTNGSAGGAGSAGTSGGTAGAGAIGKIVVTEYYTTSIPFTVNSLTIDSPGSSKKHVARITNNGSVCATASQDGSWVSSVSRPGTGQCTLTTNGFLSAPYCQLTPEKASVTVYCRLQAATTTTSVTVACNNDAGSDQDANLIVECTELR